ncbi:mu-type opioid receptor, partial [Biomphalaria glabrata]
MNNNASSLNVTSIDTERLTYGTFEILDILLSCVLIQVLAVFGLVGTGVNIIILSRYDITTDSSNILLVSLSLADFCFCLTVPI